jgi:hypothetical protein
MSIKSLKNLIFSFTDFEFLASINLVDFEKKKIDVKKIFFNRLIGSIKQNVEIRTRSQLQILINNIKDLYLQRLAFVSTSSFFKYFFKNIKIVFQSFSRRISKFFDLSEIKSTTVKKPKNRRRKNKNVEIQQQPSVPNVDNIIPPEEESESEESSNSSNSEKQSKDSDSEIEQFVSEFEYGPPLFNSDDDTSEHSEESADPNSSDIESDILNEVNSQFSTQSESDENCFTGYGESDQLI